jgi:hypothetical protein
MPTMECHLLAGVIFSIISRRPFRALIAATAMIAGKKEHKKMAVMYFS